MVFSFKFCSRIILTALTLAFLSLPAAAGTPETAEKLPGSARVSQSSILYGEPVSPTAVSDTNGGSPVFSYKLQGAPDESYSSEPPRTAGVYTVRAEFPETETHQKAQAACDFTLRARITAIRINDHFVPGPKTYDGTTAVTLPQGGASPLLFTVEGSSQQPQPGRDYEIYLAELVSPYADQDKNSLNLRFSLRFLNGLFQPDPGLPGEFFLHMDVLKAPLTLKALDQYRPQGFESDLNQVLVEGLVPGDLLTESGLALLPGDILSPENPRIFRDARDVTDQYEIARLPGVLYQQAGLEITPKPMEGLTYTGRPQSLLSDPGKGSHGNLIYQVYYAPAESSQETLISPWSEEKPMGLAPGFYRVSYQVKGWVLSDSPEHSLTLTLSPKPLYIRASAEKTYDGSDAVPFDTISLSWDPGQILPGEEVFIKSIEGSLYPQTAPGEHLKITPGNVILSGRDGGNYKVLIESFEGAILRKPVTVIPEAAEKSFGQEDPLLSFRALGLLEGETLSGSLERQPGQDPGTYAITSGSLTPENNPNYEIHLKPEDFTIRPAPEEPGTAPQTLESSPGKRIALPAAAAAAGLVILLILRKKR